MASDSEITVKLSAGQLEALMRAAELAEHTANVHADMLDAQSPAVASDRRQLAVLFGQCRERLNAARAAQHDGQAVDHSLIDQLFPSDALGAACYEAQGLALFPIDPALADTCHLKAVRIVQALGHSHAAHTMPAILAAYPILKHVFKQAAWVHGPELFQPDDHEP